MARFWREMPASRQAIPDQAGLQRAVFQGRSQSLDDIKLGRVRRVERTDAQSVAPKLLDDWLADESFVRRL